MPTACDRAATREAREVARAVLATARRQSVEVLPECALSAEHDLLLPHEEHKTKVTATQWRCGYCSKLFSSEEYLDRHLERRHDDTLNHTHGLCLGEMCDVLQCPTWLRALRDPTAHAPCSERELAARRQFCEHSLRACFDTRDRAARKLIAQLSARHCEPLSCDWRARARASAHWPLGASLGALGGPEDVSTSYYVLGALLVAAIAAAYVVLYVWHTEIALGRADLKPRRARLAGRTGWMPRLLSKQKIY